jgi:hypothetical protein
MLSPKYLGLGESMINKHSFFKILFSFLLIASIVLANVSIVFADDGTTPEPTVTSEPTEEPVATEEAETPTVSETPAPEASPSPEADEDVVEEEQATAGEEASDPALFEQIPGGTEVVVLDENGETIPLASEAAMDVILDTDPMWCPAGVQPGGPGCTTNFATINALITDMRNNTGNYTQDGVIYFTTTPGASFSLTTTSLGNGDFNTLNDYNLTLQGGWNGLNGTNATFTGTTNFGSNTLTVGTSVNPWAGNISLVNFTFNNVTSGNAITIYTTSGDVSLTNVTVSQQAGDDYTAYIDSQSGDITVQNSSFDGNASGGSNNRNRGFRAETNTGSITISNTTFKDSRTCSPLFFFTCIDATANSNGATLNAPTVTLNNVTAFNNDLSGIEINNANSVWMNNVVSYDNGTFIFIVGRGSGVNVNGTGSTIVHVNGGTLSNNEAYGLSVFSGSISTTSDPTCIGNRYPGLHSSQCYNIAPLDTTPPVLSLPADIALEATGPSGAVASFSATANDAVDGSRPVTCSPSSGSTFPLGTTTVNCSASDTSGNTANGSFNVTVQDTASPAIGHHDNVIITTDSKSGEYVTFITPTVTDVVDGVSAATCVPASGTRFPLGVTTVTCTATDSHGNSAAPVTFLVIVKYEPKVTTGSAVGARGGLFDLDCFTVLNVFGVNLTFHNLCDHQAVVTEVTSDKLPGQLPSGAFVKALTVDILAEGALIKEFPQGSGLQLDFTIPANSQSQYAVFLWDAENREWLDVTQIMKDEDLSKMLTTDTEDELYQIVPTETTKTLYRILSTEKTGTFVIVKK